MAADVRLVERWRHLAVVRVGAVVPLLDGVRHAAAAAYDGSSDAGRKDGGKSRVVRCLGCQG